MLKIDIWKEFHKHDLMECITIACNIPQGSGRFRHMSHWKRFKHFEGVCLHLLRLLKRMLSRTLRALDNALRIPSTGREPLRASQPVDSPDKIWA